MLKTSSASWAPLRMGSVHPAPYERRIVSVRFVSQNRQTTILEIARLQGTSEPLGQSHSLCEELTLAELRTLASEVLRLGFRTIGRQSVSHLRALWRPWRKGVGQP